jgi:hypothetical protein
MFPDVSSGVKLIVKTGRCLEETAQEGSRTRPEPWVLQSHLRLELSFSPSI